MLCWAAEGRQSRPRQPSGPWYRNVKRVPADRRCCTPRGTQRICAATASWPSGLLISNAGRNGSISKVTVLKAISDRNKILVPNCGTSPGMNMTPRPPRPNCTNSKTPKVRSGWTVRAMTEKPVPTSIPPTKPAKSGCRSISNLNTIFPDNPKY